MKKTFLFATIAVSLVVAGSAAFVFAQTQREQGSQNNEHGKDQGHGDGQQKMMLTINPSGKVMLRGVLVSGGNTTVGSSTSAAPAATLMVKSWGITFTVNVGANQIGGALKDISHFTNGDFVGVIGTIDPTTQVITARVVHDWSLSHGNDGFKKHDNNDDQNDHGSTTPRMGHKPENGDDHQGSTTPQMGHDGENRGGHGRQ